MFKRITHIIVSAWLAILLLFGTTPMEFIHTFANHKDTVEHYHHHGFEIEKEHHHCQFLSLHLMPFAHDIALPSVQFLPTEYIIPHFFFAANFLGHEYVNLPPRAPPVA